MDQISYGKNSRDNTTPQNKGECLYGRVVHKSFGGGLFDCISEFMESFLRIKSYRRASSPHPLQGP